MNFESAYWNAKWSTPRGFGVNDARRVRRLG
jgi:hypothetical protein